MQLKADKSDKYPDRDHGADLTLIFLNQPQYQPKVRSIMPVPNDQESEDEDDELSESASASQSRYDKFELERKFRQDTELSKHASLGISSNKNKVAMGYVVKSS